MMKMPSGFHLSKPYLNNGKWMWDVRVKRWYVPVLLFKALQRTAVPVRFWPRIFWRVYVGQHRQATEGK